jgi:hypothetical protein
MKDLMTVTSKAIDSIARHPNLGESMPTSPARVIDFVEARHQLMAESGRIAENCASEPEIEELAIRRERSAELVDTIEEAIYWLILTAVLIYLALGIFGL